MIDLATLTKPKKKLAFMTKTTQISNAPKVNSYQ